MCAYEFKISLSRLFSTWPSLKDSSLLLMYANFNLVANAITEPAVPSTHDSVIVFFFPSFFQIDALSKRSKESEAAFLSVYKRLIDVPGMSQLALSWLLAHRHTHKCTHTHCCSVSLRREYCKHISHIYETSVSSA